jgi:hypothetical protein
MKIANLYHMRAYESCARREPIKAKRIAKKLIAHPPHRKQV